MSAISSISSNLLKTMPLKYCPPTKARHIAGQISITGVKAHYATYFAGNSPPEVPTPPGPTRNPGIPPEIPQTPNVPDFDPFPPETPADPPPTSPGPNPGPEFPGPPEPKPEAPVPPGQPEVVPRSPHGPEVVPIKPPESGPIVQ